MTAPGALSKTCLKCNEAQDVDSFHWNAKTHDKRQAWCKKCQAKSRAASAKRAVRVLRKPRKSPQKDYHLRHKYGISYQDKKDRLAGQGGCCDLCKQPLDVDAACVDHDHACCSGMRACGSCIRGLVCHRCNHGLAHFERPGWCVAAELYVQRYKERVCF